ncbi:MAG: DUF3857 domain-containing protein [Cytophagales bacterium]|nr:DUF3857 domain-containing protein [Cytophaga sp.]
MTLSRFIACVFVLIPWMLQAQIASVTEYQKKYPGESAVYLVKRQTYTMDIVNDSLSFTTDHYEERLFLDANAKNYAKEKIYASTLNPISAIKAYTLTPVEDKYKSFPVKEMSSSNVMSSGVFYDDLKEYSLMYSQLQPGSKTTLSYSEKYMLPQLLRPYNFSAEYPIDLSELILICNNNITFDKILFNISDKELEYTQVKKGNYTTHTWRMKDVPAMTFEGKALDSRYYSPQLYVQVKKIHTSKGDKDYFQNQKSLYKWLYTFVNRVQQEKNPSIQALADSIKKVSSTEYELSKNIFYWVQNNINYVAFENGYEGFIPRYASDVYNKRYGDCKDMANLISQIHKNAGIDANIAWIGTRDIPYKITELPSPCDFNHMISAVHIKDSTYFLDATGKYQPFGFPTSFIQGKQALIAKSNDNFAIVEVPTLPKERNLVFDSIYCTFSDFLMRGKGIRTIAGYPKINFTYQYIGEHKEERTQLLKGYLKSGNNKCKVTNATVANIEDKDKDLVFSYDFELPDYMITYENEVFINLHLDKIYNTEIIDTALRKMDYEREFKTLLNEVIVFEIPKGYVLKSVPGNKSYKYEKAGFNFKYEVKGNKVFLSKSIYIDSLLIEKEYFRNWNMMIAELNKAYKENNILLKK